MNFAIGDVRIDSVTDLEVMEFPLATMLPHAENLDGFGDWLEPDHYHRASNTLLLVCQSIILRAPGRVILIDTCVGCGKQRPARPAWHERDDAGRYLAGLAALGLAPEQVDTVFCTHLHVDHVGWNTRREDGRWVPTFPRARYLFGRRELAYWNERVAALGAAAVNHGAHQDSVVPILEAGLADLVDDGHEVAPGVVLTPLPGHTPGQMGLALERPTGRALFCGDAIHSPVQIVRPDWSTAFCVDQAAAARTRMGILEAAAAQGQIVVPAHFRGSGRVRIERDGTGFRPVFQ